MWYLYLGVLSMCLGLGMQYAYSSVRGHTRHSYETADISSYLGVGWGPEKNSQVLFSWMVVFLECHLSFLNFAWLKSTLFSLCLFVQLFSKCTWCHTPITRWRLLFFVGKEKPGTGKIERNLSFFSAHDFSVLAATGGSRLIRTREIQFLANSKKNLWENVNYLSCLEHHA